MSCHRSVLVACDIRYAHDPVGRLWVDSLISSLTAREWTVHVLTREVGCSDLYHDLRRTGALVISERDVPEAHQDADGHTARFRARSVIAQSKTLQCDLMLVQGLALSRYVAGSGQVDCNLWTVPLDRPYSGGPFAQSDYSDLRIVSHSSTRILVADEGQRSTLDAEIPEASSKVRILPLLSRDSASPRSSSSAVRVLGGAESASDIETLHIREGLFSEGDISSLDDFGDRLRNVRSIPRILIHGTDHSSADPGSAGRGASLLGSDRGRMHRHIWSLPGAVDGRFFAADGWELLPADPVARHYGRELAKGESRPCAVLASSDSESLEASTPRVPDGAENSASVTESDRSTLLDPFDEADIVQVDITQRSPVRLVIAGSDFKFAGDLVESFLADPGFDVRFDIFKHHSQAQPKASAPYLEWADVVLSEFAVQNAIWYSQNLAPHQKLIVHLHGFELLAEWIDELAIDRVTAVVVASEFYRHQAHRLKGWPLDKIHVIPNSVNPFDLVRPKMAEARFHLGLVGMVPILKRPDRALDLLEHLMAADPRYTLHIRGHAPWNYSWEWKKAAHQDAYRDFYRRLGERADLLDRVSFEPFAPDMGNWLRKIGWLLSPSSRETFHLAAIEGAMSGAVPLAWERDGACEIIGFDWTFPSTQAISDFVLAHNSSPTDHSRVADRAQTQVERYRSDVVGRKWREIVVEVHRTSSPVMTAGAPTGISGEVFRSVENLVVAGNFDEAKGKLDRHIDVTKNDSGVLKSLEMFVRGLLALDVRRTELIPPIEEKSPELTTASGRYLRVTSTNPGEKRTRFIADPTIIEGTIGIVPFGYTGPSRTARTEASLKRVADHQVRPRIFSGTTVTDVLDDLLDLRIAADDRLRFDRWVEVVAAELRDHMSQHGVARVVIDGPWHVALPAAVAAGKSGVYFVWIPTADDLHSGLSKVSHQPYTGDIVAQLSGLLASHAEAIVLAPGDHELPDHLGSVVTIAGPGEQDREYRSAGALVFDSRTVSLIEDLASSTGSVHTFGALNVPAPNPIRPAGRRLRIALIGSAAFVNRFRTHQRHLDPAVLEFVTDLDPSFDALIVDSSAVSVQNILPGEGSFAERVRSLFDTARTYGVLGIYNSTTNVGGARSESSLAEKADAITGTRAILTGDLLARNPNSITRVSSTSLDTVDTAQVLAGLASVGVGLRSPAGGGPSETTSASGGHGTGREATSECRPDVSGLAIRESDGVSLIMPTRLGADRLPSMLESIVAQSMHPSRMELVVVHNGPEDGTADVVESFAAENPLLRTRLLRSDVEGVSAARNLGLTVASHDYVTFVDDDDELEFNYVLNLWLSAEPDLVVVAPLRDIVPDGSPFIDTPNNRRLVNLAGRRTEIHRASGLLGLNACKLIPTQVARTMQYPTGMRSGEDVAFMSQLLLHDLALMPADSAPESAYVRHLRPDSVSRQELTRSFAVDDRLAVIRFLETVRSRGPRQIEGCLRALQNDQLSFVARFVAENPDEEDDVIRQVLASGITTSQLERRYKSLHASAMKVESSPV